MGRTLGFGPQAGRAPRALRITCLPSYGIGRFVMVEGRRMRLVNFEFKARLKNENQIRAALKRLRARFVGTDHQMDTYFRVPRGRLKVREGRIENALIFYERSNLPRTRQSRIEMMALPPGNSFRKVLSAVFGVLTVVDKRREIYFSGNVKIHLDRVRGLGKFVEVEAIRKSKVESRKAKAKKETTQEQARGFQKLFGIEDAEILGESYSDLVLRASHAIKSSKR
jgi:adenylate cyclase, class 2